MRSRWLAQVALGVLAGLWACAPPGAADTAVIIHLSAGADEERLRAFLEARGATEALALPLARAVSVRVPSGLVPELERLPGVRWVRPDELVAIPPVQRGKLYRAGWNLDAMRVPELWTHTGRGAGVVVANLDTGVEVDHPDLVSRWRGGSNSWFDPFDHSARPFDPIGHGTQTMGLMVGGDASGTAVGVAPEASWIAARIYDAQGNSSLRVIHQAFAWLLDPDGDPNTADAPKVVNASWGEGLAGFCDPEFEDDLESLKTAGIVVIFGAGNSGPGAATSMSPANLGAAVAAGAVDSNGRVAGFSSRGPSSCTGGVFPDLVAPGVDVGTTDLSLPGHPGYAQVSGTSYAAPEVAGVAALLLAAAPSLTVEQVEDALRSGAADLGAAGPDDDSGHGLLDAMGAWMQHTKGTSP